MDTLKKIDFKSLDLKDLDQSISDKVKRAVEKEKKSRFWDKREEAGEAKEEAAEEKAADEAEEETAREDSRQETAESAEDRLFREMEGWKGHTIHLTIGGKRPIPIRGKMKSCRGRTMGKIRAAVYLGKRMLSAREYRNMRGRITFEMEGIARDVITYMNVSCEDVAGNIKAGGDVNCDRVEGNVAAERQVSCDCVKGSVFAGEGVTCDNVQGDVVAGGSVTCDTVNQNVTAGGSVRSDTIHGKCHGSPCGKRLRRIEHRLHAGRERSGARKRGNLLFYGPEHGMMDFSTVKQTSAACAAAAMER